MEKVKRKIAYDFMEDIPDGEFMIMRDNELRPLYPGQLKSDFDVKESFYIYGFNLNPIPEWPRLFSDEELEADRQAVFARYGKKFGYDFVEWLNQEKSKLLKEELAKRGYEL